MWSGLVPPVPMILILNPKDYSPGLFCKCQLILFALLNLVSLLVSLWIRIILA
ncbi:hypothetical protein BBU29805_0806 [Borreliella burgdorferi 29805]|nr:hypothetical protein BbuMM1_07350 [Borreliella burgdorferi]EEF83819.1 hypothetical protein BBUCA112A_0793 [Borreliella burgdorferi CA-11.2A]EEH32002.1 hypothetical protein BBUBOL26_0776 [Borreliella burgdorferi Bol26]EEH32578.1 hypothetical protein BBU29805_0806 [Borreliella burgdorferi 29805]